ncbi:MAG: hypothetical protein KI791_04105 [Cyclobacteriaceae bacterium]|nr:hypothetical protein [Cyclobacteriaceae bacterium SS2]
MKYKEEELRDIPRGLYSYIDDKPFTHCIECEKFLLSEDTEYLVERICKNYPEYGTTETIFDYALCMECAMKLHSEMSLESQQTLQNYFMKNIDLESRNKIKDNLSIGDSIANCVVSGKPMKDCQEYQVCAHCVGDKVYMGNPPYMLSGNVLEEIMNLLSNKTQDMMNGFYSRHRTPTPGIYEPDPILVLV